MTARRKLRFSQAFAIDTPCPPEVPAVEIPEISIVMPVKDNAAGVHRFLNRFFDETMGPSPCEVIVVDNNSAMPLRFGPEQSNRPIPIQILPCRTPGPAAARNVGARAAKGRWLLFCDSDCIPTTTFLSGYVNLPRAIAYAGDVAATPHAALANFYETERSLKPLGKEAADKVLRPLYLVTANSLVFRPVFLAIGGFNESFPNAAGEDVELSYRLWRHGNIEFASGSVVLHDFSDGWGGFWKRFYRYGAGNCHSESLTGISMRPRFRLPRRRGLFNLAARMVQHLAMTVGYRQSKRRQADRIPLAG